MDARHHLRITYERERWLRPDWRRWYPPGFEWPDVREAERKRAELEAREAEEAAWIEAREAEAEALTRLRWMLKDLKVDLMLARLRRKYSPDQPRVPAGNRDGGQWTSGARDANSPSGAGANSQESTRVVQAGFGHLVAEIPVPGGRRCVYNFGTFSVVAPGPTNFPCPVLVPWSAVTHGQLLNDNRP